MANKSDSSVPQHGEEEDFEPECECVQVDVDLWSACYCPAHGPHGEEAKRQRAQEAEDEFNFWSKIPEF